MRFSYGAHFQQNREDVQRGRKDRPHPNNSNISTP